MSRRVIAHEETQTVTNIITTTHGAPVYVGRAKTFSLQSVVDINVPAAKTFVDGNVTVLTDVIAIASHGFTTGLKVAATTDGTLPAGLSATNYYIIVVTSGTIKLASSLANAIATVPVPVDITAAAGGGTHTLTPASISATLTLEESNSYDPIYNASTVDWDAVQSASTLSADGDVNIEVVDPGSKWYRPTFTVTAGRLSASSYIVVKEDQ